MNLPKAPSSLSRTNPISQLVSERIPAYILAGGESRRYGQDKTLAVWEGEPLILRTVRTAQKVASEVKIVARNAKKFEFVGVPVFLDIVERSGPLAGLLTALEDCAGERCFILACDMPYLTPEWLSELVNKRSDAPVIFSHSMKGVEPLCAVYAKSALPFWWERYRSGKWSLFDALEELGGVGVMFSDNLESRPPFFNLNKPDTNFG